jgi:hypothetical protein
VFGFFIVLYMCVCFIVGVPFLVDSLGSAIIARYRRREAPSGNNAQVEKEMFDNPGEAVVQEREAALDANLRTIAEDNEGAIPGVGGGQDDSSNVVWKMETWGWGMKKWVVVYGV